MSQITYGNFTYIPYADITIGYSIVPVILTSGLLKFDARNISTEYTFVATIKYTKRS